MMSSVVVLVMVVRYLLRSYQRAERGLSLAPSVSYLAAVKSAVSVVNSSLAVDALIDAYRRRATRQVCSQWTSL